MVKASIAGYWAATAHERADIDDQSYFAWVVPKYSIRGITTAFLMVLFLKVNAQNTAQRNPDVKLNHFLVPAIIVTTIATFLECLIDQYVGPLDRRLRFVSRTYNRLQLIPERAIISKNFLSLYTVIILKTKL